MYDTINNSQHCQRNWDLTQQVKKEDLDLIIHTFTNAPSKQSTAFYKVHIVTNRDIMKKIYDLTETVQDSGMFNSQVLANVLLVFQKIDTSDDHKERVKLWQGPEDVNRDYYMSIGIATGMTTIVANNLGYRTGFCACFNPKKVAEVMGLSKSNFDVVVTLGIGLPDKTKNYWEGHVEEPSPRIQRVTPKETIEVNYID
tara:strand:- start:664 stop:1260 length:597 start_codon:yes stop_codon:yes gene_type:complete